MKSIVKINGDIDIADYFCALKLSVLSRAFWSGVAPLVCMMHPCITWFLASLFGGIADYSKIRQTQDQI